MTKPAIGFIGLGLMGSAMVERLQSLGYPLNVIANRSRANIDAAIARGAVEHATARELAAASNIIMLCVDTSASVEARMLGEDGVIAGLSDGKYVVDFGTSLPGSTRMLGEKVAAHGVGYLDAPLGRTPLHARDGLLNIMVGGEKEVFDTLKPVLDDLGENVFHVGGPGVGHTVKLINNFFAMTTATAMSEAFAMADVAGLERETLYGVMSAGPLHSGMMDFIKAYAVDGDPNQLRFAVRNAHKDIGYYARMAEDAGVPSLMSHAANQALALAIADGRQEHLVTQMVDYFSGLFSDNNKTG